MYVRLESFEDFADIVADRNSREVIGCVAGSTMSEVDENLKRLGFRRWGKWTTYRERGTEFRRYEANIRRISGKRGPQ